MSGFWNQKEAGHYPSAAELRRRREKKAAAAPQPRKKRQHVALDRDGKPVYTWWG
jgi:hypothetical protein